MNELALANVAVNSESTLTYFQPIQAIMEKNRATYMIKHLLRGGYYPCNITKTY